MNQSDALTNNASTRFGQFGGCYMSESTMQALKKLADGFLRLKVDPQFQNELAQLFNDYSGRPTPLTPVPRFQKAVNGPKLWLKREDLLHTGAHKINNALGQCLLAKYLGKGRIIAETGAGQHGLATATACAKMGLECVIYMGAVDVGRQRPNVEKMRLLGAKIEVVKSGSKTLKDSVNAALRDYACCFEDSHYCLGSALGPYPYPEMVGHFHRVIGDETRQQCQVQIGQDPDVLIACIGGGSNAIGLFMPFIEDKQVQLIGVEAGGHGTGPGEHAARFSGGSPGVLHGAYSYVLQDEHGQILPTASISAGLDYPMIGPQHAHLYELKRAEYFSVRDDEALTAFRLLSETEGIIPALESAHALAYYMKEANSFDKNANVIVNLSGRGDKDLPQLLAEGLL